MIQALIEGADQPGSPAQKQNGRTFVQPLWRNTLGHLANSEGDDISLEMASKRRITSSSCPSSFSSSPWSYPLVGC
jgi:hypothetical protein